MSNGDVRVLVLSGHGINCERETAHAVEIEAVGASADCVHANDLMGPDATVSVHDYDMLVVPGGFSYGDNIASGRVLANKLKVHLADQLQEFHEDGKLIFGICNGFQVIVKMGLLPGVPKVMGKQNVTVTYNDSGKFEDRWVYMDVDATSPCVFTRGLQRLYLPVRHGEGKVVPQDRRLLQRLETHHLIPLRYAAPDGGPAAYPWNPNGSVADIAGLCDATGRIFGMMPHPEAFLYRTNHPRWTREKLPDEGQGVALFRNAVRYLAQRRHLQGV